ncbi:hypothetical protein [Streptomyces prunicolor]
MSAPMKLTAEQVRKIAAALDGLTEVTQATGVDLTPNMRLELGLDDNVLHVSWDGSAYVIDDRNGD